MSQDYKHKIVRTKQDKIVSQIWFYFTIFNACKNYQSKIPLDISNEKLLMTHNKIIKSYVSLYHFEVHTKHTMLFSINTNRNNKNKKDIAPKHIKHFMACAPVVGKLCSNHCARSWHFYWFQIQWTVFCDQQ